MSHIASYMIGIGSGIGLERYLRGPRQWSIQISINTQFRIIILLHNGHIFISDHDEIDA